MSQDFSEQLTRAKNLLARLHGRFPETRSMIEASTGNWFVWGQNRAALTSAPKEQAAAELPGMWERADFEGGETDCVAPVKEQADHELPSSEVWAELHRLRVAVKGPTGYATWQAAATDERIKRVRAERALAAAQLERPQEQAEPVGGNAWAQPTTYLQRFGDALQLLCNGLRPADEVLKSWLENKGEGLQEFACAHGPVWAQGIGLIDAARVMADQPTEDVDHELLATQPERLGLCGGDAVEEGINHWRIDHSAGRPILVYKDCSVIEAEQAYLVLGLLTGTPAVSGEARRLSKELARLADIMRDCKRLISTSGNAEHVMREASDFLAKHAAATAGEPKP